MICSRSFRVSPWLGIVEPKSCCVEFAYICLRARSSVPFGAAFKICAGCCSRKACFCFSGCQTGSLNPKPKYDSLGLPRRQVVYSGIFYECRPEMGQPRRSMGELSQQVGSQVVLCMSKRTYVCMHACMHACMYGCMCVGMYVYLYVCMSTHRY